MPSTRLPPRYCPTCAAELQRDGRLLECPEHGTLILTITSVPPRPDDASPIRPDRDASTSDA